MIGGGVGTALADINLKLGSTTTGYYAGYSRVNYSGASAALASDNNASAFSRFGSASTDTLFANCDLSNPYATKRTIINGFNAFQNSSISGGAFGGFLDDATSYTSFTVVISSGTATGGTIAVYGYNNG